MCLKYEKNNEVSLRHFLLFILMVASIITLFSCGKIAGNQDDEFRVNLKQKIDKCRLFNEHQEDISIEDYDSILFGNYEKLGEIEWIVLENNDNKVLLLSKYIITYKRFNRNGAKCKYESSDLFEWANNAFINNAFNKKEQLLLNNDSGKIVKLIDSSILNKYFKNSGKIATNKLIANSKLLNKDNYSLIRRFNSSYFYGRNIGKYWISEIGDSEYLSEYIDENGSIDEFGDFVDSEKGFRPIIELNFNNINKYANIERQVKESKSISDYDSFSGTLPFDTVVFGKYEQDNNFDNGPEDIEWMILKKEDDKVKLMSKYIIDRQPYYAEGQAEVKYEESYFRQWLNDKFYNSAFSDKEKEIIIDSEYKNNFDKVLPYGKVKWEGIVINGTPSIDTYMTKYVSDGIDRFDYETTIEERYLFESSISDGKRFVRPCISIKVEGLKSVNDEKFYEKRHNIFFDVVNRKINRNIYNLEDIEKARLVTEYDNVTNVELFDTVVFGSYEQDGDAGNGKEGIEWIVVDRDNEKALLLSKYILDNISFHSEKKQIYWGQSTARTWCNRYFIDEAIGNDGDLLIKTKIKNLYSPIYELGTELSNEDTEDRAFFMGLYEARKYFDITSNIEPYNVKIATSPTECADIDRKYEAKRYIKDKTYYDWSRQNDLYWLRTNGEGSWAWGGNDYNFGIRNSCIFADGKVGFSGTSYYSGSDWRGDMGTANEYQADFEVRGVRPMVWIDISNKDRLKQVNYVAPYEKPNITFANPAKKYDIEDVGLAMRTKRNDIGDVDLFDTIKFGHYEQDNNVNNGKEDIEWLVVDDNANNILLLSKYVLDCVSNGENNYKYKKYENSEVAKWLNDEFLNTAFTDDETSKLAIVKNINNPLATQSEIEKGYGKVFLVNRKDIEKMGACIKSGILTESAYLNNNLEYRNELRYKATFFLNNEYNAADDGELQYTCDYSIIGLSGYREKDENGIYREIDNCIINFSKYSFVGYEFKPKGKDYELVGIRPAILIDKNKIKNNAD